jgi:hypothetical protein
MVSSRSVNLTLRRLTRWILRLEEILPYIGIRAGLARKFDAGVEEEQRRMSRV